MFSKSDLIDNDIVTYRNGEKRIVIGTKLFNNQEISNTLEFYKNNLEQGNGMEKLDVVKVERPTGYATVFERKKEILDKAEKRYLRQIIRPFRDKVKFIIKMSIYDDMYEFIEIKYSRDYAIRTIELPDFVAGTMYKGMEDDRIYTLKELGL